MNELASPPLYFLPGGGAGCIPGNIRNLVVLLVYTSIFAIVGFNGRAALFVDRR